jgi:hypothetical protein
VSVSVQDPTTCPNASSWHTFSIVTCFPPNSKAPAICRLLMGKVTPVEIKLLKAEELCSCPLCMPVWHLDATLTPSRRVTAACSSDCLLLVALAGNVFDAKYPQRGPGILTTLDEALFQAVIQYHDR